MLRHLLCTGLLFLLALSASHAQIVFCPSPPPPGAPTCKSACTYCQIDGLADAQYPSLSPPQVVCGGAVTLHAAKWYSFIAGTTFVEFVISTDCKPKGFIGAVISAGCQTDHPIACVDGTGTTTVSISAFNLTVGQAYQLGIGALADTTLCDYTISVNSGSASPPTMTPLLPISGPVDICPGAEADYSIPSISNYLTLTWTAPPGASIDGGGPVKTFQPPLGKNVHIKFGAVGGKVCVRASAYCQNPQQQCLDVVNTAIPPTVLPEVRLCLDETPFIWTEDPYFEIAVPGTYNLTSTPYASHLGCDSIVKQRIIVSPPKIVNLGKRYLCENECFPVGGMNFCQNGDYEVVLDAFNGCDSTVRFSIEKIPAVAAITAVPNQITCANSAVVLSNTGSTTGNGVVYLWRNSALANIGNGSSVTVNAAGNYYLIVSNTVSSKTCRDTAQVFIGASTGVPTANAGAPATLTCALMQTQLAGSGSAGAQFQYLWTATNGGNISLGSTTLTPTVTAAGTYTLRVTNTSNGCTAESITNVLLNNTPPDATASGGTFTCAVPNTNLQIASATPGATFAWGGPGGFSSNLPNPSVSTAGAYSVTVTSPANGCTTVASATVIANTAPPGAAATGGTLTCELSQIALNGSALDTSATFAWAGPGGFSSASQNPTANQTGTYILTTTGSNGCTSTASATVNLDNALPAVSLAPSGNLNCNNLTINLIATATGGAAFNFNWQTPSGPISTGNSPLLVANEPGQYTLQTINTTNGCSSTTSAAVVQHAPVSASASAQSALCNGAQNGSAAASSAGGDGNFSFAWSTGASTSSIGSLPAGDYLVTVTDGEGCSATATTTVAEPEILAANASATGETALGNSDGTATADPTGGTAPYEFAWETGATTQSLSGLAPGSYNVTVSDANGCTAIETATVNAPECAVSANIQATNVNCFGENNGSASVQLAGVVAPISYQWSTGATTETVSGLAPGVYSVSILDARNCPAELTFSIAEPSLLSPNATATNASGTNQNNGTATANPTGGTQPYQYLWNNGATTQSLTDLAPGFYTVIVTDANGCIAVHVVEVGLDNCGLAADFVNASPSCNGLSDGSSTLALTGGTAPFTYAWSNGDTSATIANAPAGNYAVTVTDAVGCQVEFQTTLAAPAPLGIAVVSVENTICPNDPIGAATVAATGGTGTLNYQWSNGQTGPTATGLVAGSYTAAATDANGCEISTVVSVAAIDTEAPSISAIDLTIPIGPSGEVVLDELNTGVLTADNCLVTSVTFDPASFDCTQQGQHAVTATATDAAGNSSTTTFNVTIIDDAAPEMECSPSIVRCFGDNVVAYQLPSAEDNCEAAGGNFALVSGLSSGSPFPLGTTAVTYSFTDAAGNVGSCSFEVTILTQLTVAVASVAPDTLGMGVGSINLNTTGSLSPYSYVWTKDGQPFPATTEDISGLGLGNYQVVVTDANGCTAQGQVVMVSTGAAEPAWAIGFALLPNPTSGQLSAIFPETMHAAGGQITVFDATGRRVHSMALAGENRVELDLSTLADGLYSVLVQVGRESLMRKIVVAK